MALRIWLFVVILAEHLANRFALGSLVRILPHLVLHQKRPVTVRQEQLDHVFSLIQEVVELIFVCRLDSLLLQLVVNLNEYMKRSLVVRNVLHINLDPGKEQLLDTLFLQVNASEVESGVA